MEGEELEPGVITYIGENGGLTNTQRFYFLINELETQMVYYCGDLLTWHFEGLLIQSKYPQLSSIHYEEITEKLDGLGLSWDDLCPLNAAVGCKDAPSPTPFNTEFTQY